MNIITIIASGLVSLAVAMIAAWVNIRTGAQKVAADAAALEQRLRSEFALEYAAERAVKALISDERWEWRSFKVIKHHLGGFEDNELRKLLVRAGAIRSQSTTGVELWGLLWRNREALGFEKIDMNSPDGVQRPQPVGEPMFNRKLSG